MGWGRSRSDFFVCDHVVADVDDIIRNGGVPLDYTEGTGLTGTDFQAFILLHELGHLTGAFGDKDADANNMQ